MECLCPSVPPLVSPRRKVWISYIHSISIRQFCKISISIKYRIDSNLAYRTGLDGDEDVDDKSYKVQQQENEDGDDNGRSCAKEISKVAKCSSVKMKISKNVKMKKPKLMQMYPQGYHLKKRRIHQLHDECPRVLTRV